MMSSLGTTKNQEPETVPCPSVASLLPITYCSSPSLVLGLWIHDSPLRTGFQPYEPNRLYELHELHERHEIYELRTSHPTNPTSSTNSLNPCPVESYSYGAMNPASPAFWLT